MIITAQNLKSTNKKLPLAISQKLIPGCEIYSIGPTKNALFNLATPLKPRLRPPTLSRYLAWYKHRLGGSSQWPNLLPKRFDHYTSLTEQLRVVKAKNPSHNSILTF